MAQHEFITSSDFRFGDIMINFCDPEFLPYHLSTQVIAVEQVYKMVSYALFASRLIIPSRYLLQPGVTFDAVSTLESLLEEGVIVPDLREGYSSFVNYAEDIDRNNSERMKCARFLDEKAKVVYSFDIDGQSTLYHKHLLDDISENGLLRKKIDPDNSLFNAFEEALEEFSNLEGSRRAFVSLLSAKMPDHHSEIQKWAALRYYTTPAELEPRCFRDFPASISDQLRKNNLSIPSYFTDPDQQGNMPEPFESAHKVLISLPEGIELESLRALSNVVLDVRKKIPEGAAKFASLSEQGFRDNLDQINETFRIATLRERRLYNLVHGNMARIAQGLAVPLTISWGFGISLDPLTNACVELSIAGLGNMLMNQIDRKVFPFVETSSHLKRSAERTTNIAYLP